MRKNILKLKQHGLTVIEMLVAMISMFLVVAVAYVVGHIVYLLITILSNIAGV